MLRFKLKELIADKAFKEDRRITIAEVAEECGLNRMTLSKIANRKGCSTNSDNLDKLCRYFDCSIEDLVTYIKDDN
jgi:DNA-binding Xre family transcriptional regulator